MEYIDLNTAFPVKIGWRHICVRKLNETSLDVRVIGICGEEEEFTIEVGKSFVMDNVTYTLIAVLHPAPIPEDDYVPKGARHVAGILSASV